MPPQTLQPAASYSPPPTDSGGGALQPAASYSPPPQQGAPQQGGQAGQGGIETAELI
jgi:hypothetical protein